MSSKRTGSACTSSALTTASSTCASTASTMRPITTIWNPTRRGMSSSSTTRLRMDRCSSGPPHRARTRLADMLRYAGAAQLAAGVDPSDIVHIVPLLADEAGEHSYATVGPLSTPPSDPSAGRAAETRDVPGRRYLSDARRSAARLRGAARRTGSRAAARPRPAERLGAPPLAVRRGAEEVDEGSGLRGVSRERGDLQIEQVVGQPSCSAPDRPPRCRAGRAARPRSRPGR